MTAPLSLTAASDPSFRPLPPPGWHRTSLCLKLHNPERGSDIKSFRKVLVTYSVDIGVLVMERKYLSRAECLSGHGKTPDGQCMAVS